MSSRLDSESNTDRRSGLNQRQHRSLEELCEAADGTKVGCSGEHKYHNTSLLPL